MRSLLCLALLSAARAAIDYESLITDLWTQTDTDKSDDLSEAEFVAALKKLDVDEAIFTSHGKSAKTFYAALSGGDKKLTKKEMAGVVDYPQYKDAFIAAFSNGAGQAPSGLPELPAGASTSK